jgi:hypothetical protein
MVLAADGMSSNSWRFWTEPAGDAYLACRDNFKEGKLSLHTSGRWRMGCRLRRMGLQDRQIAW